LECESPVTIRDITLGIPTKIGAYTYISGPANLRGLSSLGRFCSLGNNIIIGPGSHPTDWLSTSPFQYNAVYFDHPEIRGVGDTKLTYEDKAPVIIGNDVWIGSNVTILRGVKVGDGAIVASGAIVTKDVLPYSIVGGVPSKLIKYRFTSDIIESLIKIKWWDYDLRSMKNINFNSINTAVDQLNILIKGGKLNPRASKWVSVKNNL
jgi:acetyltransferase-like isoleucine patch superfamily enzyme